VHAVSAFIPAHYILGTTFVPHSEPFHFIPLSFHTHTSAPHSFGSLLPFHSASSINSVSHYPSHLPTHFQRYIFIFCGELAPIERILLIFIGIGFFFQKDSKGKYNKDFLSRLFTDKKIKNLAKIRRPTQTNALGSKGRALRVFAIISTLRFTSGSILPKNLDSPIRPPKKMAIFFFFFFFFFSFSFLGVKIIYGRSSCF